jgi:hypothetical protein
LDWKSVAAAAIEMVRASTKASLRLDSGAAGAVEGPSFFMCG